MTNPWGKETKYFFELTVDKVLGSLEKDGININGHCLPYHCFENRVYQVGRELDYTPQNVSENFVIAKFYRPGRWSREQIQEEHDFLLSLEEDEIPAVAPLKFADGETIHQVEGTNIFYTLFPKIGGRNPYDLRDDQIEVLGRLLARIHGVGAVKQAHHRVHLDTEHYAQSHLEYLLSSEFVPKEFRADYKEIVEKLITLISPIVDKYPKQRIHGDCHIGNVIMRDETFYFVDFDDFVMAHPVQDIWLLFPGRDEESIMQRNIFIDAYEEMRSFDRRSLELIEPYRALRLIHYTGWIAKRIDDPVFTQTFSHFQTPQYWGEHINDLRQQHSIISS